MEAGSRAGRHRRRSAREPAATAGAVRLAIRWRSGGGRLTSRPPPAAGSPKGALSRTQSSQISRRVVRLNRNRFGPFYCMLVPFSLILGSLSSVGSLSAASRALGSPRAAPKAPGRVWGGPSGVPGGSGEVPEGSLGVLWGPGGGLAALLGVPWPDLGSSLGPLDRFGVAFAALRS